MVLVEVADSNAVADDEILETPVIAENLLKQTCRTAAGVIVQTLIGAHHFTNLGILYQRLEGRHVGLPEVTHGDIRQVGCMAGIFRTTVDGIVLGTGPEFTILGILRPLQAFYHLYTHDTRQVGVFAVGLLTAPPTGVTENVDVRCPDRETAHLHVLTLQVVHTVIVLGTELGTGDVENLI